MKTLLKILVCISVFCLMFAGSALAANSADMDKLAAEMEKLTQDLQSGKIDMPTFQQRMMEMQSKIMQSLDPAIKQHVEQAQQNFQQAPQREPNMLFIGEIPVPSELIDILPPGHREIVGQRASLSGDIGVEILLTVLIFTAPDKDRPVGAFTINIISGNPEVTLAKMHTEMFRKGDMEEVKREAAEKGVLLRQKTWGWGYSSQFDWVEHLYLETRRGVGYAGKYAGIVGDVTFMVTKLASWGASQEFYGDERVNETLADKVAELAQTTLRYENLYRLK